MKFSFTVITYVDDFHKYVCRDDFYNAALESHVRRAWLFKLLFDVFQHSLPCYARVTK